jgi:head-tail adaptor
VPTVQLDRKITVQQYVIGRDAAFGGEQRTWADVCTVWAGFTEFPGTEQVITNTRVAARKASFRVRWRGDLVPSQASTFRVKYGARTFLVDGPATEIGRREWLDLNATEFSDVLPS